MASIELDRDDALAQMREHVVDEGTERAIQVDVDGRRHTVEPRPVYEFEREIVDSLIGPRVDSSLKGAAIPIKGRWIAGWLETKGEDYINNIWKNYQFFLKYLEAATSRVENISTHQRAPGTYESMYRYLILLEDLGVLERFRRVDVPASEYDFPVPEEFRTRTFIRITRSYEEAKELWDDAYGSMYPQDDEDEEEAVSIDVEPVEEELEDSDVEDEEIERREEIQELDPLTPEDAELEPGTFTPSEDIDESESELEVGETASIEDFNRKDELIDYIEDSFPEALERTFEEAPIPQIQSEPDQFGINRKVVLGLWANGEAITGQTRLKLMIEIDSSKAPLSPTFIPLGVQEHLSDVMRSNNRFSDTFPDYEIEAAYTTKFTSELKQRAQASEGNLIYWLEQEEFEKIE